MNKYIEMFQQWILKRDKRERYFLFFISFIVIYYIWHVLFISSTIADEDALSNKIADTQAKRQALDQQYKDILTIVKSKTFIKLLGQEQSLTQRSKNLKQKIASFYPVFVKAQDFSLLTKDILNQINSSIQLVSLKEFPDQPWTISGISKDDLLLQNIYEHKLAIEFIANYFDTVAFLTRLESLPWHLYWDSLEYKVINYPEADIVIQFYVLSNQMGI